MRKKLLQLLSFGIGSTKMKLIALNLSLQGSVMRFHLSFAHVAEERGDLMRLIKKTRKIVVQTRSFPTYSRFGANSQSPQTSCRINMQQISRTKLTFRANFSYTEESVRTSRSQARKKSLASGNLCIKSNDTQTTIYQSP